MKLRLKLNGMSDRLSAPANVLVEGRIIKTISAAPIATPAGSIWFLSIGS